MNKNLNRFFKVGISTAVLSSYLLFSNGDFIESPFSSISVEAATVTKYTTTANLNLRSTNSTKGKILLTIPKGKQVTYIKKSGNWYQVKYNGKTGWVSSKYIKVTKTTTAATSSTKTTTIYTTTANLNLRSTNSTKGKILLTIPKGKQVTYIKKSGTWYQVKYNGKTGWVSSKYIKQTKKTTTTNKTTASTATKNTATSTTKTTTTYTTTANLNLRSTNSTKGKILLTIPKGKQVTYIKKSGNWYQVKYNGKTGWVSATYIKVTKVVSSTAKNTLPATNKTQTSKTTTTTAPKQTTTNLPAGSKISNTVVYTVADLNYRQSDSTSAKLLGTIPKNTKLTTDYKTKNKWYKVTYNGKTGFVSGAYLIDQATKDRITKLENNKKSYIFMDLRTKSSVTAAQIDAYINNRVGNNRSVLKNTGKYFIAAGNKYGVNALYLAAHAIHESNFGKSTIALDRYNLFGYGAYDLVPYLGSVKFASIEQNIHFIAQKMKATYLGNSYLNQGTYLGYSVKSITGVRVDALSKGMNFYYATDPNWGEGIAKHMNNILDYSKESAKNAKPNTTIPANPSYPSGSDVFPATTLAVANSQITLYTTKSTSKSAGVSITKGKQFYLLEKDNNYWLKVKYSGKTYYAKVAFNEYNKYFTVKNLGRVAANGSDLNVLEKSNTSAKILGTFKHKQYIELVLDKNLKPIKENNFYKVKFNGKVGWASASYIVQELNK